MKQPRKKFVMRGFQSLWPTLKIIPVKVYLNNKTGFYRYRVEYEGSLEHYNADFLLDVFRTAREVKAHVIKNLNSRIADVEKEIQNARCRLAHTKRTLHDFSRGKIVQPFYVAYRVDDNGTHRAKARK